MSETNKASTNSLPNRYSLENRNHHISPASSSSTFANKQKHNNLKLVRAELDKLEEQLNVTDSLISTACIQTNSIKKLGIYHSSLFMAVSSITEQSIEEIITDKK